MVRVKLFVFISRLQLILFMAIYEKVKVWRFCMQMQVKMKYQGTEVKS